MQCTIRWGVTDSYGLTKWTSTDCSVGFHIHSESGIFAWSVHSDTEVHLQRDN